MLIEIVIRARYADEPIPSLEIHEEAAARFTRCRAIMRNAGGKIMRNVEKRSCHPVPPARNERCR